MESTIALSPEITAVMDAANDAMAIVEPESGSFVAVNDTHIRLFGYTLAELNKLTLGHFYNIANTGNTVQQFSKAANYEIFICSTKNSSGATVNLELTATQLTVRGKNYLLLTSKALQEPSKSRSPSSILSIERAFKDSEAKWQSVTENSPDHIMLIDTQGKILFINHTLFGLDIDEVIGGSCYEFVEPKHVSLMKACHQRVIKTGQPGQFEIDFAIENELRHLDNRVSPVFRDGEVIALTIASRDITPLRRAHSELEKSQRQLQYALKAGRTGTWEWDVSTDKVSWSDGVEALFGMKPGTFNESYDAFTKLVHPDDLPNIVRAIEQTLTNNTPYYVEYRSIHPDGSIHWYSGQGELIRDAQGKPQNLAGTVTDITQSKLAEAALLNSQQKLTLHFQQTPLGVVDWNTDFEVTEWNPAAEKIFGYSRREAIGHAAVELIVPESAKKHVGKIWQSLLKQAGGKRSTNENITKNGSTIICEWYNTPLVNNAGEVIGVSSLVHDVTDQVVAQRELEKHRQHLEELVTDRTEEIQEQARILDQIHDSVIRTDIDGIVSSWNNGAQRLFGFSADEAIGQHIAFVYPEDQQEFLATQVIKPLHKKGEHETEVIMCRRSGDTFHAMLSLTLSYDDKGNPTGIIGFCRDISARKHAEAQILRHQKALENANRELEAFSYSVSHDLRAPLRSIDGYSAVLLDDYDDKLDDEGKEVLARIRQNTHKMGALIDDLLQLSRVTRHNIEKESLDLGLLATDVIQKYFYEHPDRKVEYEFERDMAVEGDAGLMRIVLDNLIGNAWKYTSKRDFARIKFNKTKINGSTVYCIEDNGVGFDMRYADKLFGAFQRLHRPEEFSGNGIGLATVSRIICRHGGKIWAEGKIDGGAKFYFTLQDS